MKLFTKADCEVAPPLYIYDNIDYILYKYKSFYKIKNKEYFFSSDRNKI